jgi:putative membrane protein
MSDQPPATASKRPGDKLETELLANERTFLAWVRTSIAVMGLGFVIARFGLWLRELAVKINPQAHVGSSGLSLPLGATIISFGAFLTVLAGWRYHIVNRAIERGKIEGDPRMVVLITVAIAILAVAIIAYMLVVSGRA